MIITLKGDIYGKKIIFKMEKRDLYTRGKISLDDPVLKNYQFLSSSPIMKKKYMSDVAEKEYVDSYLQAAKMIAMYSKLDNPVSLFEISAFNLNVVMLRHG